MTGRLLRQACRALALLCVAGAVACTAVPPGRIAGHVTVAPGTTANPQIRMTADPVCQSLHADTPAQQELVLRSADGGLANVFVYLKGSFRAAPVPATPIEIDQRGCLYRPRVQGARAGQVLRVRSSDATLHSIRGRSDAGNDFALSQPTQGMVSDATLRHGEVMLRVRCDVHNWMRAYIGVVDHQFFAVSDADGRFALPDVPPGNYTLVAWHETLGTSEEQVIVPAGGVKTLEIEFGARPAADRAVLPLVDVVAQGNHLANAGAGPAHVHPGS